VYLRLSRGGGCGCAAPHCPRYCVALNGLAAAAPQPRQTSGAAQHPATAAPHCPCRRSAMSTPPQQSQRCAASAPPPSPLHRFRPAAAAGVRTAPAPPPLRGTDSDLASAAPHPSWPGLGRLFAGRIGRAACSAPHRSRCELQRKGGPRVDQASGPDAECPSRPPVLLCRAEPCRVWAVPF
jgi:hypothetical protein